MSLVSITWCYMCVCYVCYVCRVLRGVCFGFGLAFPLFFSVFGVIFFWAIFLHGFSCHFHSAVTELILRFPDVQMCNAPL